MTDLSELNQTGVHHTVDISATVNGRKVSRRVPIHYRVIDFVREELKLTGNKEGCGAGECGTCSMFVDGELMKSCLMPVQKINGRSLETVESLDQQGTMSILQQASTRPAAVSVGTVFQAWSWRRQRSFGQLQIQRLTRLKRALAAISVGARDTRKFLTQSNWRAM